MCEWLVVVRGNAGADASSQSTPGEIVATNVAYHHQLGVNEPPSFSCVKRFGCDLCLMKSYTNKIPLSPSKNITNHECIVM